jgi:hypothetical protein
MINEHDNVLMNMWRGMRPMSIKNFFDTYLDFFFFFFFLKIIIIIIIKNF